MRTAAEVIENRREGAAHRLVLRVPGWPESLPGQFAMLSPGPPDVVDRWDPLLPRPMAVYRSWRQSDGADVEILYKIVGRGTALLARAERGDRVRVLGPLGRGFPEPGAARAILVGGGTGIASLYELASRCLTAGDGAPPTVLLGAREADDLMGRGDFEELGVDLRIATEDGSEGERGLVTDLLDPLLGESGAAHVYACGPTPMMRRAAEMAAARDAACSVSLENTMACGFGVCLGCAAPRSDGTYALVCRDGPVFEAGGLAWDGLP